jgi:sodium/proline symporter
MTGRGALAGMIVGAVTVVVWKKLSTPVLGAAGEVIKEAVIPFSLYEIVPGFILAWVAIVVFSSLDREPSNEILVEFEEARKEV